MYQGATCADVTGERCWGVLYQRMSRYINGLVSQLSGVAGGRFPGGSQGCCRPVSAAGAKAGANRRQHIRKPRAGESLLASLPTPLRTPIGVA